MNRDVGEILYLDYKLLFVYFRLNLIASLVE